MTDRKPTAAEHEALHTRVSALSAVSLRVSSSLNLQTVLNEVLNEVLDGARALTGARFGTIATIDEAGARDFGTSDFTEAEHRRIAEWPDGPRLFERFRDLPRPAPYTTASHGTALCAAALHAPAPSTVDLAGAGA